MVCFLVTIDDAEVISGPNTFQEKGYEFKIVLSTGGIFQLYAESLEERDSWIQSLNMVMTTHRKRRTQQMRKVTGAYNPNDEDDEENYQLGEDLAKNCEAFGPGLFGAECGHAASFSIVANDARGQPMDTGGLPFTASLENEDLLYYFMVTDNQDGTYEGQYITSVPGDFKLHIMLNDEHHVYGSPFSVQVMPSKTYPFNCHANGPALKSLIPGQTSQFVINACDKFGNEKMTGGDPFEVSVQGPATLCSLEDCDDGTYICTIEGMNPSDVPGITTNSIEVDVTLKGKKIMGSPFKVTLEERLLTKMLENPKKNEYKGLGPDNQPTPPSDAGRRYIRRQGSEVDAERGGSAREREQAKREQMAKKNIQTPKTRDVYRGGGSGRSALDDPSPEPKTPTNPETSHPKQANQNKQQQSVLPKSGVLPNPSSSDVRRSLVGKNPPIPLPNPTGTTPSVQKKGDPFGEMNSPKSPNMPDDPFGMGTQSRQPFSSSTNFKPPSSGTPSNDLPFEQPNFQQQSSYNSQMGGGGDPFTTQNNRPQWSGGDDNRPFSSSNASDVDAMDQLMIGGSPDAPENPRSRLQKARERAMKKKSGEVAPNNKRSTTRGFILFFFLIDLV